MTKKPTYEDLEQRVQELVGFAQNSEISYREIFDLATDMIIIQDINTGEILEVNDEATRVTGFTPDEIKRMGVAGFSPKSENFTPEKADEFKIKAAQGEPQLFEWGLIDKSGKFHPTEVHIKKVSIRGQARLLGIVRDITERKRVEETLKRSEANYRSIFNAVNDAVFVHETETGRILDVNQKMCEMYGYSPEEVSHLNVEDLSSGVSPYTQEDALKWIKKAIDGDPQIFEWMAKNRSGRLFWVEVNLKRVTIGGRNRLLAVVRDISERKQSEEALLINEEKYRGLFDESIAAIYVFDSNKNFIDSNQAGIELLGYSKEELLNMSIPDVDADPVVVIPAHIQLLEGDRIINYEHQLKRKDGRIITVLNNSRPISDFQGNVVGMQSTIIDITASKYAEAALRKSEEKYRLLAHNMNDVIFIQDINHNITYTSPSVTDIFGYSVEETYELELKDLMTEDSIRKAMKSFQKYAALAIEKEDIDIPVMEYEYIRKDGSTFWGELKVTFLRDPQGQPVGSQGAIRDITHRKQAEEALRESEEKYKLLAENSGDVIYKINIKNERFTYLSPSVKDMLGYTAEEAISLRIQDIMTEESYLKQAERLINTVENGQMNSEILELEAVHKDGHFIPVEINARIICDEHENPVEILGVARDITERKQLEEQLRQTQKMESVGNLAGGIAHDFNNILFPIVGLSEMLLEDLPPGSMESQDVQQILTAGMRGVDLVKQILAFSRQSEHKMIPVRIQQILKEVLKLSRSTIPSDIKITEDIQPDCGFIMADPAQLHQIAMNLITNAYHAVEESSGKVSVKLREIAIEHDDLANDSPEPGQYAMLSVADTGCGIDPNVMDKIFEPYFTTKEQGKGTGLGLAVVHGIVKEHKGDIEVYSDVGKGTTFNIYLPLMEEVVETAQAQKVIISKIGDERILLVDDEEAVARLEKQMLERLGYQVTSRTSSLEALEAFRANPDAFDLVVTDMTMPNMTGDQLAKELMSIRADIPVIICTGFSERINKERARAIGIKGLLMKPVVKFEMAQMLRRVLDEAKDMAQQ